MVILANCLSEWICCPAPMNKSAGESESSQFLEKHYIISTYNSMWVFVNKLADLTNTNPTYVSFCPGDGVALLNSAHALSNSTIMQYNSYNLVLIPMFRS